ncbi:hypothetical protein X471_00436 [Bartonella bacilliformis str. Heidi Mejia]|uniref:DUF1849 family protein n=2 Tax=Bartonella bacilliformis TaxID=774 RepID=A1USD8_BARBK|nr:DUF1849 family protein [Bartonella bacilliformis]ABM45501.1 conserved hypothetical protein [Bartonella bacilliformis KC583]AMG85712.1 DUF1849 domain-containing protein [Bartonella bacilliformis]EKS44812.1 hypothetical protein BbINS_02723 [Bartonella bacilliformis INS]EYS89774.1 hypothetical protein X472_00213 [Bartonella bacilliformis San Pedro600-02]EYS92144.1 hypothetical protein X471_00436 [Bartonella bacilliformis str. Heidi Mejia]
MVRLLFILGLHVAFLFSARAEEAVALTPHRVIYDFKLGDTPSEMKALGMSGRLVHELIGSECKGYKVSSRFISRTHTENVQERITDQQIVSYETSDGRKFHFEVNDNVGQEVKHNIQGVAERTDDGIVVKLKKPKEDVYKLPLADFPTMYLKNIIRQAKANHHLYQATVFDGTGNANKIIERSVIIGEKQVLPSDSKMEKLDQEDHWPVQISYYDDEKNKGGLPTYHMSFLLSETGIMRDLSINYGEFSMHADLVSFELLDDEKDSESCKH